MKLLYPIILFALLTISCVGSTPDPGTTGPYAVSSQTYNYGNLAYTPPGFPTGVEVKGIVFYPTNLAAGPFPLLIFLHGRHESCYETSTGIPTSNWPCLSYETEIPSYTGYNFLAQQLASHGYIVVSIGANSISASDANVNDQGMSARSALITHHLDLWKQFNTTGGSPFGTTFVGKVDLTRIGTMGHSRGGEGVMTHAINNQSAGSGYNIKAVLAIAPTNFYRPVLTNIPFAVVLPYCDGDVVDLQGIHYYDDARYITSTDPAPKHYLLMMGANHNYFNTVWSPSQFAQGTADDWTYTDEYSYDPYCAESSPSNKRLTETKQRAAIVSYASAFFRQYVGGENQFVPILNGDDPTPPASSTLLASDIHVTFHPAATNRKDLNRTNDQNTKTVNTAGAAVSQSGLSNYIICGDNYSDQYCLGLSNFKEPHSYDNLNGAHLGLSQLEVKWTNGTAYYENKLPAALQNLSQLHSIQFRAAVNFKDYTQSTPLNFSVQLHCTNGDTQSVSVSSVSNALYIPPGTLFNYMPRLIHNTIKIPLNKFNNLDLAHVDAVRFNFNKSAAGAINISDLILSSDSMIRDVPVALFSSNITTTCDGLVAFSDGSAGNPSSWMWDFGDGTTSNIQNPIHTYTKSGSYAVKLFVSNSAGKDSLIKTSLITVNRSSPPTVTNDKRCSPGTVNLSATAIAGGALNWYDAANGGSLVNSGTTYTPSLNNTTSYFVEETGSGTLHGGKANNTTGGGGYLNTTQGLIFNVLKPCTLKSVTTYAPSSDYRAIELVDGNGNVISSITPYISSGQQKVTLDFPLAVGTNYTLRANSNSYTVNLYRNNDGVDVQYPYTIGSLISITNTTAQVANPQLYYYYFYDWEVQGSTCLSDRVEVKGEILNCTNIAATNESELIIYPNPAKNSITIEQQISGEHQLFIAIKNVLGETIGSTTIENNGGTLKKTITIESFPVGIYFVSIAGANKNLIYRFVKE